MSLILVYKNKTVWANIGREKIWEGKKQKLLDLAIDKNLNFNEYVSSLSRKADNMLTVLAGLSHFMPFKQSVFF